MNNNSAIKEYIEAVLENSNFTVLATEGNGQPHTSLIAITPFADYRQVIFATYRNTLKYRNLSYNNKVAVLIEGEIFNMEGTKETVVLTIIGQSKETTTIEDEAPFQALLKRHPNMEKFMLSSDCALIRVTAQSYQVVHGIDDLMWISAEELDSLQL